LARAMMSIRDVDAISSDPFGVGFQRAGSGCAIDNAGDAPGGAGSGEDFNSSEECASEGGVCGVSESGRGEFPAVAGGAVGGEGMAGGFD